MDYSAVSLLVNEIKKSDEYIRYQKLKENVTADALTAALIKEYRNLQVTLQLNAMNSTKPDADDMTRFSGINTLLFSKPEVSQFLLSEMQVHQILSEIYKLITNEIGIQIDFGLT